MDTKFKIKNRLLECGVKPSLQRMAIMECLIKHPVHPTVDMIYSSLYPSIPTLSKTTVYNTLKLLLEQGVIHSIHIDEKNIRYDADISKHGHFKCKNCGNISDLQIEGMDSMDIKNKGKSVITETHFYFIGYCENCKNIIKN